MTTNQGNETASFIDEASVDDEAREDKEVRDSPIDLHNMVDLCDISTCHIIPKRTVKGKQVIVACGHLADECPRRSHAEQR
jgi:hypothetical protein